MKKILLIALVLFLILFGGAYFMLTSGLSEGANVVLDGVNLASKPDGSYMGTYDFKRWTNTLIVDVKDHKIVSINFYDDAGTNSCADETFYRVINAQDTKVEAVSGATVTSKSYLKAIENALK